MIRIVICEVTDINPGINQLLLCEINPSCVVKRDRLCNHLLRDSSNEDELHELLIRERHECCYRYTDRREHNELLENKQTCMLDCLFTSQQIRSSGNIYIRTISTSSLAQYIWGI